ncbi:MAG: hypothetical protein RBR53_00345 [Desulforegulaceae bacterium]|nr:hypothetical protein [Desulforegulaceae bacterium]
MNKTIWLLQITGLTSLAGCIILFSLKKTETFLSNKIFSHFFYFPFALILGIGGTFFLIFSIIGYKKNKSEKENIDMSKILSKYSGQITSKEFSLESGISPEDSKVKLDKMYKNGICNLQVTESGIVIYYFPDFEPEAVVKIS